MKKEYSKEEINYINMVNRIPKLSNEEVQTLLKHGASFDDKFRKRVIEAHLYLVIPMANSFANNYIEFLDLIEEGNIILVEAVDNFQNGDYSLFIRYLNAEIYYGIICAIKSKDKFSRLPFTRNSSFWAYKQCFDRFVFENGEYPKENEMAEITKFSEKFSKHYYKWCFDITSLNEVNMEKEEIGLTIVDDSQSVEEIVENEIFDDEKRKVIYNAICNSKLSDKQKFILIHTFGFYGHQVYTKKEIEKIYGCSRQNIIQMQKRALNKIKSLKSVQRLIESIDYLIVDEEKNKLEKIDSRMCNSSKNIYDYFKGYTKEEVDEVIEKLDITDIQKLHNRYDTAYNVIHSASTSNRKMFLNLSVKMRNMLDNSRLDIKKRELKLDLNKR